MFIVGAVVNSHKVWVDCLRGLDELWGGRTTFLCIFGPRILRKI